MNFLENIDEKGIRALFSDEDLKIAFNDKPSYYAHNGISYALKTGQILKLRRGLYLKSGHSVSKYKVANLMYSPSFVSYESALSFHGLIPEAVYTTTSACALNKKKEYETPLGFFSFEYSPCSNFFIGVEQVNEKGGALMANAPRALFDLIHLRRKKYLHLSDLEQDLRIDLNELSESLKQFNASDLIELASSYTRKYMENFATLLIKEFK